MTKTIAKIIQGIGTLSIGVALLWGMGLASKTISQGLEGQTIQVTGKARRSLNRDESVVTGTWQEEASTSDEARNKVKEKSSKGLDEIKKAGIEEKKITTTQISVYPEYNYRNNENKITGYRASTTLEIKLTDAKRADQIISLMTKNGATSTTGPSLGVSQAVLDEIEKELKAEAVANARAEAEKLAEEAGARLGEVISIGGSNISGGNERPYPLMRALEDTVEQAPAASSTDISVGEEEITATVSVSYRLK